MIDQEEPQRLFESPEAPGHLRSLLVRAHEDVPTAVEKAELVKAALGRGGVAVERPPIHGRGSTMRWTAKVARRSTRLWSVAAIVGVGAGALYVAGVGPRAPLRAAKIPATQTSEQPPGPDRGTNNAGVPQPLEQGPPSGVLLQEIHETASLPAAEPASALVFPGNTAPEHAAPRHRTRRALSMATEANAAGSRSERAAAERVAASHGASPAPVARHTTPAAPAGAPDQPQPTAAAATTTPRPNPGPPPEPGVEPSGTEEATLLRSARQALARSPRRTLSLTNEHRLRYPHGILDQEREALAIEALIKLGRLDEARPRARSFALTYPGSPHRARLERALMPSPALDAAP